MTRTVQHFENGPLAAKHALFNGVRVSATTYDEVVRCCLAAAERGCRRRWT